MPQSLVTPKGESVFACVLGLPRLNKYSNENEWTMGMRWKPEDCLHLRNKIDEEFTEAHGKKKGRLPYDFEAYENENGDKIETGYIKFKFKRKEKSKKGELLGAPKIVDANLRPWDQEKLIGNGSIVRASFSIFPYNKGGLGVSLFLKGVQVLKHVEYDPDADAFSVDQEFADDVTEFEAEGTPSSLNVDSSNVQEQLNKVNQEDIPF